LTVKTIALLAALVPRGQYAQVALRSIERTGSYGNGPDTKQTVGDEIAAKGADRGPFTYRHDILRKQILETRTKGEGASIKNFIVPR
jgi:hypothetical protein